jgi:hypothetical protein
MSTLILVIFCIIGAATVSNYIVNFIITLWEHKKSKVKEKHYADIRTT